MSVTLTPKQRDRLLLRLLAIPRFKRGRDRYALLRDAVAGTARGERLLEDIDDGGTPRTAISDALDTFAAFGEVEPGQEALQALLNSVMPIMDAAAAREVEAIMAELGLAADTGLPPGWRGTADDRAAIAAIEERVMVDDPYLPARFLSLGSRAAGAVVRIRTPQCYGTGFMVTPQLMFTAAHVFKYDYDMRQVALGFGYQEDENGLLQQPRVIHPRDAEPLVTHQELDFALLRVDDAPYEPESNDPLAFVRPLRLARDPVLKDDLVPIIQHPEGEPKKVALKRFVVVAASEDEIQDYTSTSGGSSGAPVFNREFQVVGLHQRYRGMADGQHGRNQGTPIGAILRALQGAAPAVHEEISRLQAELGAD